MVDTPGKKLRQARNRKKLSIEDVARATRMHPDRVQDLENDEYGNFPNLAYGRNFLLLYARHLGLDSYDVTQTFERHGEAGLDDYEYLANTSTAPPPSEVEKPKRSLLPIVVVAAGAAIVFAMVAAFLVLNAQRLGDLDETPVAELPDPPEQPEPTVLAAEPISTQPPVAGATPEEVVRVMKAEPVETVGTPVATAYEIVLKPLKRTRVTVHEGGPESPVVFSDYLDPTARPLTMRGDRFFIQAENEGADLQIIKNGQEIAYTPPGLSIQ